jgi:nitrite reductase/ring-hydroxylating ferredoxin subunit
MGEMDRRQFVAAGLAACAGAACPALRALAEVVRPVDSGPLEDFKASGIHEPRAASFFLVNRAGRLYAVSSTCTHKQVKVVAKDGAFKCPRHGSTFAADGKVTKSPARKPLPRYGIRLDDRGHVIVDPSAVFGEGQWDNARAFVAMR